MSVVIVTKGDDESMTASDLLQRLAKRFGRKLIPHSVYIAETVPRNENGKVLRNIAQHNAQSGIWRQVTVEKEQP